MLDFSGISTERLRKSVKAYHVGDDNACKYHSCDFDECPFNDGSCLKTNTKDQHILFKEELNRREKDMNKMPELKAGMIVDIRSYMSVSRCVSRCVLLPVGGGLLPVGGELFPIAENWNRQTSLDKCDIERIYYSNTNCYMEIFKKDSCLELIWSKKSDKDIKIEEIQCKMDELRKELEELKG